MNIQPRRPILSGMKYIAGGLLLSLLSSFKWSGPVETVRSETVDNSADFTTAVLTRSDINYNLAFTSGTTASFNENGTGTVYTAAVSGPGSHTALFSLGSSKDEAAFTIDANTGDLTFLSPPDFEKPASQTGSNNYEIEITATIGDGSSATHTVTIAVIDLDESVLAFTSGTSASFDENGTGTVYTAAVSGPGSHTTIFSLGSNKDEFAFAIDASSGVLTFVYPPNYEYPTSRNGSNSYEVDIIATLADGSSYIHTVTISVIDVEDGVIFTSGTSATFTENGTGTVYKAAVSGAGANNAVRFSLGSSKDEAAFFIGVSTGILTFKSPPDYEQPDTQTGSNNYEIDIVATLADGTSATQTVTITVNDLDDSVLAFTSGGTASFNESLTGTVYTAAVSGPGSNTAIFSLIDGKDATAFNIGANSGELTFKTPPDYEQPSSQTGSNNYEIDIQATIADGSAITITVIVTVNDLDESVLVFTSGNTANFDENATGTVYTAAVTGPGSQTAIFSLGNSKDEFYFNIVANSGDLTFKWPQDYENRVIFNGNSIYEVDIIATLADGSTYSQAVIVTVNDVDEPPVFVATPDTEVNDNETYSYRLIAFDAFNKLVTDFTLLNNSPSWLSINEGITEGPELFAGNGNSGTDDGTSENASFSSPTDVAVDSHGNLFIAESGTNGLIRKVTPDGVVTTFAGGSDDASGPDGSGTEAGFIEPSGIAIDSNDNIYVSERSGKRIRKITPKAVVTTIATFSATLEAIAVDFSGNIFVSSIDTDLIYKVTPDGTVSPFAGEGIGTNVSFTDPISLAFRYNTDQLTVAEASGNTRIIIPSGQVFNGFSFENTTLTGFLLDRWGNYYYTTPDKLVKIFPTGLSEEFDIGFTSLSGLRSDFLGNVYLVDQGGHRVYKLPSRETVLYGKANVTEGTYGVTLSAEADGLIGTQSFIINVTDVSPPEFTSASTVIFAENGTSEVYTAEANDLNGPIAFSLSTNGDGDLFSINENTGVLTFNAAPDFEAPKDSDDDNAYVVDIMATDANDFSSTKTVTITVTDVDEIPPSGYSVMLTVPEEGECEEGIHANNIGKVSLVFSGAEIGATFVASIVSEGNSFEVTGVITAEDETLDLTFFEENLKALPDGTVTVSASLTDSHGNAGEGVTDDITKDTVINPATVTIDQALINSSNQDQVSITIEHDEIGSTFEYSVLVDGVETGIKATGEITAATQSLTGIDLSGVGDGEISFRFTVTDAFCQAAFTTSGNVTKDTTAPTAYGVSFDQNPINSGNVEGVSFTITGGEIGASFTYGISSSGGGEPVTGEGSISLETQTVSDLDLSSLPDGVLTVRVVLTDENGNAGVTATSGETKDTQAPTAYGAIFDQTQINSNNVAGVSFTLSGGEIGSTFAYGISSSGGGAELTGNGTVSSEDQVITDLDLSGLNDGTLTLTLSLTDENGNTGEQASATTSKDVTPPTAYGVVFNQAAINSSNFEAVSFTITGAEIGSTFIYGISSSVAGEFISGEGTISQETQTVDNLDLSSLSDGTLEVTLELTDSHGNTGTETTATATKDVKAPGVVISSTASDVVFAASFSLDIVFDEEVIGFDVTDLNLNNATATNFSGSGKTYAADIAPIADGVVTVAVDANVSTDAAGNGNTASNSISKTVEATNEAPTAIDLSANTIVENTASGFEVGTFSVTDVDLEDTHTLALVSGDGDDDNGDFEIIGNVLKTATSFDFETKSSLSVRIRATDVKGATFVTTKTISVSNVDEPKMTITISDPDNAGQTLSEISFADTRVGETATRTFTVSNTGTDGNLVVNSILLPNGFSIDESTFALTAGTAKELTMTFTPAAQLTYSGTVDISSNAGNGTFNIAGNGLVNNAPVATPPATRIAYASGSNFIFTGYDPDGDEVDFEIVAQPALGTLTATSNPGEYAFTPNDLSPETLFEDEIVFKVVEKEGTLASDNASYQFSFEIADVAHEISSLTVAEVDADNKNFTLAFDDQVFNDNYELTLEYLDRTDPLNAVTKTLANITEPKEVFSINGNTASLSVGVSKADHPHLFDPGKVLVTLSVATANGFSDEEVYILENDAGGVSTVALSDESSGDGDFFIVAFKRTLPENETVSLNLIAVEFGAFNLVESTLEITRLPQNGTVTAPVESRKTTNLSVWNLDYASDSEIGLLDSLEFSVTHPDREETISTFGYIEIIEAPDAPVIESINDQEIEEDGALSLDINVNDPDSEIGITVLSSDAANVPVTYENGKLTVNPVQDYSGEVTISLLATETDAEVPLSDFEQFVLQIVPVNDRPEVTALDDLSINEDNTILITLGATDVDAELPVFDFAVGLDNEVNASFVLNGNQLLITPAADFFGVIEVQVTADDQLGTANSVSEPELFKITVNPVNDQPEVKANIPVQTLVEGFPSYTLGLEDFFSDKETSSSDLVYTLGTASNVTFNLSGSELTISPVSGNFGVETVTISASDGELSVEQNITFVTSQASGDVTIANPVADLNLNEDFGSTTIDLSGVFSYSSDPNADFSYNLSGNSVFEAEVDGNIITLKSIENKGGTDRLFVVANVDGKSSFTSFEVAVNRVNDQPFLVAEISDEVTLEDEPFTKVISASTFDDIDGDELTFKAVFEADWLTFDAATGTFTGTPANDDLGAVIVTITASDADGAQATDVFIITVNNTNDDPTDITLSEALVNENLPTGTEVGTLTASDPDLGDDNFEYALVSGEGDTDNDSFSISGNQLLTAESFNFEGQSTYSVRVRTRDGFEGSYEEVFIITVDNVNEGIYDIALDNASLAENGAVGVSIGQLTSTDPDEADQFTYALVSGEGDTDNALFSISGDQLLASQVFNFEDRNSYSVRIRSTDAGGLSYEEIFAVNITNVNEVATSLTLQNGSIDENTSAGGTLDSFVIADPDDSDSHTYNLVSGEGDDDNASFSINENSLVLNEMPDFEAKGSYSVRVSATDAGGLSIENSFEVLVNDINEAPTQLGLDNQAIPENEAAGAVVGNLSTIDQDQNDSHSYSLVTGEGSTDNDAFEISGRELKAKNSLNFEEQESYTIRVRTEDAAGLALEESFQISVTNVAEAIIRLSEDPEEQEAGRGMTVQFDISVFNDGDGDLIVTSISYPEGFLGSEDGFTVLPGESRSITVTFAPEEVRSYSGQIEINSNLGTQSIPVIGIGTIVTDIDDDLLNPDKISLYPVPAIQELNIDLSELSMPVTEIALINAKGLPVFHIENNEETHLKVDVSKLSDGMYLLRLGNGPFSVVRKVIIRK